MIERRSDRVLSILLSVLIHTVIFGALVWGWWRYRQPRPTPQTLAIEATVVHNTAPDAPPPSAPTAPATPPQPPTPAADTQALPPPPTPTPPTPAPPTPPTPAPPQAQAQAQAQQEQQEQQEQQAQQEQEQKRADEQKRAKEQKRQQEKADQDAAEQAATERQAKLEAERKAQEEADRKAKEEAGRKAQELAQQRKAEQDRAQREADMRSQLAAEEHMNAVQASPAKAEYLSLITARINRAWIRPPSARPGVKCTVHITQIPGGEITHVTVQGCNGDEAVRQSVETAAYRASPLPAPADPALFDPNIDVTFAPDE